MNQLFIGDFAGKNDAELRTYIESEFQTRIGNGLEILIAHQLEEDYSGCSFFLLRDSAGNYFENHASHCSCYGYEEQWNLEPTTIAYLKSDKFHFYGQDEVGFQVEAFIKTLS